MTRRDTGESGSLSIELAMLTPALLLIFGLIVVYGRVGQVNGTLESGTRDAARAASLARSTAGAQEAAQRAVRDAVADTPPSCRASLKIDVGEFIPGQPLRVATSCTYDVSDVGIPGVGANLTSESSFVSVVDDFRSTLDGGGGAQ